MASPAHLVAHQFTPERARAMRAKAQPALKILAAHRSLDAALKRTKGQRIHLDGPRVVAIVSDLRARLDQSLTESRSTRAQVERLSRMPSRADYRRAVLERNLGRATVEPEGRASKSTKREPIPAPIPSNDEPRMIEPCGFAPRRPKV